MGSKDWFVTDEGQCEPRPSVRPWDLVREHYYFHQFLSDIMGILSEVQIEREEWDRLPQIRKCVRQLVMNSYWLRTRQPQPNPQTGIGVLTLYDEIGYPLTVHNELTLPDTITPIHNHGTWGVVAVISGKEEHTFWRRKSPYPSPDVAPRPLPRTIGNQTLPATLEKVGRKILYPGEIVSFMPDAIHQVTTIGPQPALSFCIYGDTQPRSRFRFDPVANTAKLF
ncbi:MAG: cupin [Cyanothece sp. SIO2G6]|nr:cupin [Cyanothece sp. SIO2G6]